MREDVLKKISYAAFFAQSALLWIVRNSFLHQTAAYFASSIFFAMVVVPVLSL